MAYDCGERVRLVCFCSDGLWKLNECDLTQHEDRKDGDGDRMGMNVLYRIV